MGFFCFAESKQETTVAKGLSIDFVRQAGCKACPLNKQEGLKHPNMEPTGAKKPLIYMLGEAPGVEEDRRGEHFVGASGQLIRSRIPQRLKDQIRWNNVVRTRPPGNRTPVQIEIEACRNSIVEDIEKSKPKLIIGFGYIPLTWVLPIDGLQISVWRGKIIPVQIGNHKCWFMPTLHPVFVSRNARKYQSGGYSSEHEHVFDRDLKKAFKIADKLPDPVIDTKEDALSNITIVTGANGDQDVEKVRLALKKFAKSKVVGLDYETNGVRPFAYGRKFLSVGLADKTGAFAFAMQHRQAQWTQKQFEEVKRLFIEFLETAECRKAVHNLVFEMEWTGHHLGRYLLRNGKWEDTQAQAYIIDERKGALGLDDLCVQYFGINIKAIDSLNRKNLEAHELTDVLRYNGMDAKYHRKLYLKQRQILREEGLGSVYSHHKRRVVAGALTQLVGIPVDQKRVSRFDRIFEKRLRKIESKIAAIPEAQRFLKIKKEAFRPSANHDMLFMCNKILKKPVESVGEEVLVKIKHPIVRLVLDWRETNKLHSTYVKPLLKGSEWIYPDGMLHPQIKMMATDTGRTSSGDPNIQNFPSRENKEIRTQIRVVPGEIIIAADYAQIQARNVAMESLDKALVQAFWNRYDIHADWVHRITKRYPKWIEGGPKALEDATVFKKYRNRAKNQMVFPSFFGAQARKISTELGIPENLGKDLHEEFWDMFPDIKGWHERIIKSYYRTGYVTGCSGYRRRAPIDPNQLINAPIQADEAIIVCDAWSRLSELDYKSYQAMLMVHDDLSWRIPYKRLDRFLEEVIPVMVNVPFEWAKVVPIGIEVAYGEDWFNMKPIGEYFSDQFEPGMIKGQLKEKGIPLSYEQKPTS